MNDVRNKPGKNQFIAAGISAALGSSGIGEVMGFSAILLPQLEEEFELDPKSETASWIASLVSLGQIVGALFFGGISGIIGRRLALISQSIPTFLGWILIGISEGCLSYIYAGRILTGIGFISTVGQMYLVEIPDSEYRGMFGGLGSVCVSSGILVVYILGALLNWRVVCLIFGIQPIIYVLALMIYLPETPPFLASKDQFEKAEEVLTWLRGPDYDISEEMNSLRSTKKSRDGFVSSLRKFSRPSSYKPLLILIFTFFLQQWTGSFAVIFYAVNIFKDVGISGNNLEYAPAIIVGLVRTLGTFIGTVLLKKICRKTLLSTSSILAGLILICLAVTLHFNGDGNFLVLKILSVVEVVAYILAYGIGLGTVPWILLGELSDIDLKGTISGIATCVCFISLFFIIKLFPLCLLTIGPSATYLVFAGFCGITVIFTSLFVPETKGKTLQEIQEYFGRA